MEITADRKDEGEDNLARPMPTRELGRFGWRASALAIGGVKWDTMCSDADAVALIRRAIELGVNTFDTAHGYGGGESERRLGLALDGFRDRVWLSTKTMDRTYDGAMRQMETSLERLRTDHVDVMFVHSLDDEDHYRRILAPGGVLRAMEEMKADGRIRHIGVSGHWVREVMERILRDYPFEAVLFPAGLINLAYDYSFIDTVVPVAREQGIAVFGMKVMGAGRVKHARSIEPYLRYTLSLPIDAAVIGVDSVAQLEELVWIVKSCPPPLSPAEQRALFPEALAITQQWDAKEFSWAQGYKRPAGAPTG